MIVEYKLTYRESLRSHFLNQRQLIRNNPVFYYALYGVVVLFLIGMNVYITAKHLILMRSFGMTPAPSAISSMILMPILWMIMGGSIGILIPAAFSRHRRVAIAPSCVTIGVGLKPIPVGWDSVALVEENGPFIFIAGAGKMQAICAAIPRRVFDTVQEAETFFDQAQTYWGKAAGVDEDPSTPRSSAWPPAPKAPAG